MAGTYTMECVFRVIDRIFGLMDEIDKRSKVVSDSLKGIYMGAEKATARFGNKLKSLGGEMARNLGLAGALNINKVVGFVTRDTVFA